MGLEFATATLAAGICGRGQPQRVAALTRRWMSAAVLSGDIDLGLTQLSKIW